MFVALVANGWHKSCRKPTAGVQTVFALLFATLRRLAQPASPSFQVCLSILDTISRVRARS